MWDDAFTLGRPGTDVIHPQLCAEWGSHSILHYLMSGMQSCGLEVLQTDDVFVMMILIVATKFLLDLFSFKSDPDCICRFKN